MIAGVYGTLTLRLCDSATLRDVYRHTDRADTLKRQLTFLTRSGIVMQSSTAAKKTLISAVPDNTDWATFAPH